MNTESIITRFAPSPTGELHIGSARTALFAYLAAKSTGGKFYLRIEDTDQNRYVEGAGKRLIEALDWLGLTPDNRRRIILQSDRIDIYQKYALKLVKEGRAYICTCSRDKLEKDKEAQVEAGKLPRYDGTCREKNIQPEDVVKNKFVFRLKMPESGTVTVHDLVRGEVKFDLSLFDDQVLLKSDGFPTYHLASVVDDHETGITHVLRAEEWLSSTPKHLVIYKAFGWEPPKFGHFSMILAPDRSKLSKRHGAKSVEQFREEGYLKEAIINFIALLGWSPKTDRELFTLEELIAEFKLKNLNKAPAIFNVEKLNSLNAHYLQAATRDKERGTSELKKYGLSDVAEGELELVGRGGYKTLKEAAEYILKLRQMPEYDGEMLVFKKSDKETTLRALELLNSKLAGTRNEEQGTSEWNGDIVQKILLEVVAEGNMTNGDVFWPVRVALSGEEKSPSPAKLAVAIGRDETVKRIKQAIAKLQ